MSIQKEVAEIIKNNMDFFENPSCHNGIEETAKKIEQYIILAKIKELSSFLSYSPTENNLSCFFNRASEGRKLDKLFELHINELKKGL